jgi:sugar lactone lactonase YvrE
MHDRIRAVGRRRSSWGRVGAAVAVALGVSGAAVAATALTAAPAGAAGPPPSGIYVANEGGSNVTVYPLPSNGHAPPSATISSSTFANPYGEAFDAAGDLWVSNYGGDTVAEFTAAQLAAAGSPTPAVVLSSTGTSLDGPVGLAFDRAGNLWVADYTGRTLNEFTPAQLVASGAPVPKVTISATGTALDRPEEIAFDPDGDLWSASTATDQVQEYSLAQLAASGSPVPAVTITANGTSLDDPVGVVFDNAGDLWVSNYDNATVVEYAHNQLAANGNPVPTVTLGSNATHSIDETYQMAFDSTGNLWLANIAGTTTGSVTGFSASQLTTSGSPNPTYQIAGSGTGLTDAAGLALATPPQAPTNARVSISGTTASASWTEPMSPPWPSDYQVTPIVNGIAQATIDTHSDVVGTAFPVPAGSTVAFKVTASDIFGTGPAATSNTAPVAPGYWEVASDGGLFSFGNVQFYGSMGGKPLNKPIVGMAATPDGAGYWEVATDGGIFSFGDAQFYGSTGAITLNQPIVGMAATPDGKGYWLVASDGGIFAYGDAQFYGSMGGKPLNKPIVGMTSTADGKGYWLVASDGGIFSFGDASFHGSTGSLTLVKPIVGMASTPDGGGYWLVAADGGLFTFGDGSFHGSMGGKPLNQPVVGMLATADGGGYYEVATDGGLFTFGDATFLGSMGGKPLNKPVVGMA